MTTTYQQAEDAAVEKAMLCVSRMPTTNVRELVELVGHVARNAFCRGVEWHMEQDRQKRAAERAERDKAAEEARHADH